MQAAGNAGTLERLGVPVLLSKGHQAGHLILGEPNFFTTKLSQFKIFDFVRKTIGVYVRHECFS